MLLPAWVRHGCSYQRCRTLNRKRQQVMSLWHVSSQRWLSFSAQEWSRHREPIHHPTDQDFLDLLSNENKERAKLKFSKIKPARSVDSHPPVKNPKTSAVLVPLCLVKNEPSLIFTVRSHRLKSHRGEISFPGGKVDETDRDLAHTAMRETEEELGIDQSVWEIWGLMHPIPSSRQDRSGLAYPVVASTGELNLSSLRINHDEVAEVFSVTLRHLCNPAHVGSTQFRLLTGYTLPVFHAKHRIWGLTAIMVHQLLTAIAPNLYHFKLKHRQPIR